MPVKVDDGEVGGALVVGGGLVVGGALVIVGGALVVVGGGLVGCVGVGLGLGLGFGLGLGGSADGVRAGCVVVAGAMPGVPVPGAPGIEANCWLLDGRVRGRGCDVGEVAPSRSDGAWPFGPVCLVLLLAGAGKKTGFSCTAA